MSFKSLQPKSNGFEEHNKSYFTAFNNDISPSAIACPESADQVAQLVREAAQSNSKIGIRGAGNTPWKGAANIDNGLVIDMRNLTGVTLNADKTTVSIGAGERWGNVYETLAPEGLATIGGGLSYFSGRRGFVCDAVTNFEVVLASGEIVNANKTTNQDLFAALKGGSNNFGVVTKIDFPTFPQDKLWGGMTVHPGTSYPDAVRALHSFATSPTPDPDAHVLLSTGWAERVGGELTVLSTFHASHSTVEPGPESLSKFTAIEPRLNASLRQASLVEFTTEQSSYSVDGGRNLYFTTTIKPDIDILLAIQELFRTAVEPIKGAKELAYSVVLQPFTTHMLKKSAEAGQNALGIATDDGPYVNVLLNPAWSEEKDDEQIVQMSLDLLEAINKAAEATGKAVQYRFLNYSHGSQKVIESYGKDSGKFLRGVSAKYDPNGFFQKNVPGGFKLGLP
ncbi:FAD-binding domain-containing protein [Cucurbitaria berberidis CBS 394.84]|uniref:FAD-binding domain-containing protein n=1 Tax=Cucurbitaria berberidis CBS 394.84 TaxID=1168544 RepID=A0A9P4GI01_9PLEO|nr:FAD-binding domain-containing protein [Cucurbitaria berberidis CBS 394.84]KAF1846528.1 FAD-binding domain-containing protein [Cucurbitaria berberidis CBS 394.84]